MIFSAMLVMCFFASNGTLFGQNQPPSPDTTNRAFVPLETMAERNQSKKTSTTATMTKSPMEALWRSVLPGLGQLYVESYWKAPIFFGGATACVVTAVVQGDRYNSNEKDSLLIKSAFNLYVQRREFYRDTRDAFIIAAAAVWAISAIDAFVGAHLYDFDVSDETPDKPQKTSLHAIPYIDPVQLRVGLAVRW